MTDTIALLEENRQLRMDLDAARAEVYALRGEKIRNAIDSKTYLVPERELPALVGVSLAELRRLRRKGTIRGYPGTQPKKKRYTFNVFEVAAAIKQERQLGGRLAFDVGRLFERHNIPSARALSGVS